MSAKLATRTFRATGADTAATRTIFTGSGILLSVIVANTLNADDLVNFTNSAGTNLFSINVPADSSMDWSLEGGVVLDSGLIAVATGGAASTIISAFFRPQ